MIPAPDATRPSHDLLASWDRMGFRFCFFGALGILWVIQGVVGGQPLSRAILSEVTGLLPWVFLTSIVLAMWRRFPITRERLWLALGAHLLGMALVLIPYWVLQRLLFTTWAIVSHWNLAYAEELLPTKRNLMLAYNMVPFTYAFLLLGAAALDQSRARREEEAQARSLAGQLAEARLNLLQHQLHPHFLFNALQAISTLLHRDPQIADRLLVRLSSLLRAMLDEASAQTLSLRMELDLTRKYLEIEQARFADRLTVRWEVEEGLMDVPVPSLVVLPLVENAIRHGLSPKVGPGTLTIRAAKEGDRLCLSVEDDGLGAAEPLKLGIGIGNTRERLHTLHGARASLGVDTRPGAGFRARIQLPLPETSA